MDSEKIIQELNRRFAAPLPEFYKRRIIIWHDEDKEFEDKLSEISLINAKIVALTGSNYFTVKKLLCVDDTTSNFLVYCPISIDSLENNWLLDIELYGEEFRADLVSMWMDEMGVSPTPQLRSGFKAYRKFFNSKERRKWIMAQKSLPTTLPQLQLAVMAALSGLKEAKPNNVIRAVLEAGLSTENNEIYQSFVNYEIDEIFWKMVEQGTGCKSDSDLSKLAVHILLTAATRTMRQEFFAGMDTYISTAHQSYCYDLVSEWLHSVDNHAIHEIAEFVETKMKLHQRFMKLTIEDLVGTEMFPSINEVLLIRLMKEISDHIIDTDLIKRTVEKRRTCVWYSDVENFFDGIMQLANMQEFYKEHSDGFHTVEPQKLWKDYTSDYYIMDTYYRLFHKSYSKILSAYNTELSDLFTSVRDKVEGLYSTWFLGTLGDNWSAACAESMHRYGRIIDIPQQADFYHSKIENVNTRAYVIISDAMRYEVAVSLVEHLRRDTQCNVELSSMQGIFPTITKFGMAALLPQKKLSVELKSSKSDGVSVLADGQSTDAGNRENVLKTISENSVVLKYDVFVNMKRSERKASVKGMDVVYIYHDTIDNAGHSEKSVFEACDNAIEEITNCVRIITSDLGSANILITSDHGFLYTYNPLREDDKVDLSSGGNQVIEVGRRYAIMVKGSKPEYLLPVKFLDTDYDAFTPRENIRIKIKGSGLNFVHGGISLQEMVVPVIEYHFLRNDHKEYINNRSKYDIKPVTIGLLSSSHKISNMIFSLNFYQKEAVSTNREAMTYQLYFIDSYGNAISDVVHIIADKTSPNPQDRTFRCNFNLKSLKYSNTESYYLVIADQDGFQESKEEFQIDIAFAVDEFDFFS